jgi:hypothetical protein
VPLDPRFRVVPREFSEEFGGCGVVEAPQAGAIVIGNEGVEIGVAFGMVGEAAMGAQYRSAVEMLAEAAVDAVGLRLVVRLGLFVGGKAIGELGAVIGQRGMNGEREAVEKALEKPGRGIGPAIGQACAGATMTY